MSDVRQWLESLGLGRYADAFEENDIGWSTLLSLDHDLLKEIGVKSVGHRVAILNAIASLGDESLSEEAEPGAAQSSNPITGGEAQRRQLTVMFCDLVGSTELSQQLDPEDMREINRAYQDACKVAIERYEGYVARYMGDGVLAYFGYPQAHEDDAERAIHAGLGVVESVPSLDTKQGIELGVRVGIATGPVVVGDLIGEGASQESAVVGETPNLAARLQGLAVENTVVIAPGTHDLVGGRFEYDDLGSHSLKGIAEPVNAWRVASPVDAESRFELRQRAGLTPLVGREHEIGLLLERWAQAKEGDGQVVLLSGEAGIGKSRITDALQARAAPDEPVRLRYQCSPHHTNSALHPVIQSLEHAAQIERKSDAATKLQQLEQLVRQGTFEVDAVTPLLASLLSIPFDGHYSPIELSPEQQKTATLRALCDQMEGLSKHQPVLVIYEDTHWADPTSVELLELIVERVQTLPVMVVITYRPEFEAPWTGYSHVTALALNRFTRSLASAMVARLTEDKSLPHDVVEQIIEKTDGVPLFVEELTKTILESGQTSSISIPATLHDSLMARLDRLGAVKEVAQTASVIGREFGFDLLATVSPLSFVELHDALAQLVDAELLFRRTRSKEDTYLFKHALVQNAAYESLLLSARRDLHQRIAEALETRFPETAAAQPDLLGYHYSEAGIFDRALGFWRQAGQRAVERSGNLEAIAYFNRALSLVNELPDHQTRLEQELALQTALAGPLITIKGYGAEETGRAFARAQTLSAEVGVTAELFPVMYGRWVYGLSWQRYAESMEVARQFSDLSAQQKGTGPILMAHRVLGISQYIAGEPAGATEHLEKVISLYKQETHAPLRFKFGQDPKAAALAFLSLCLWQLGYPDRSAEMLERSLAQANELKDINTIAYVNVFGATLHHHLCSNHRALESVALSINALADQHSLGLWKVLISIVDGWIQVRVHNDAGGLVAMRDAIETSRETFTFQLPYKLSMLAETYLCLGNPQSALEVIDEAVAMANEVREGCFTAELHRIRGVVLSRLRSSCAEAALLKSLECARANAMKGYELRAATSLARVWLEAGNCQAALDLLAPVYAWFTEGFDTPDLKQAKALLDELS